MQPQLDRARLNSGTKLPGGVTGAENAERRSVTVLGRGAAAWNAWRAENDETSDLSRAGLRGLELSGFDFSWADLRGTDFRGAKLCDADPSGAR